MLFFATAALAVHVDARPPPDQTTEQHIVSEINRAGEIINELKQSPDVIALMRQLKPDIDEFHRTVIQNQIRHKYETALYAGDVQPGLVTPLASLFARNIVEGIHVVLTEQEDSIVIYFLCNTKTALYKLGQMVTSGYLHDVFESVIQSLTHTVVAVDVYIRAEEFNLRLSCLSSSQDTGLLFDR